MRTFSKLGLTLVVPTLLLATACSSEEAGPDCEGDTCDTGDVIAATPLALCEKAADFKTTNGSLKCTPCGDALVDQSGRGFLPAFIANDDLVKKVYMTFEDKNKNKTIDENEIDCPIGAIEIMAKLEKTDNDNCQGIESRVVSEQAAKLGKAQAGYRAVTTRTCGGRGKFGLMFSMFGFSGRSNAKGSGLHISEDGAPGEVEIIAFDKTEGVFNFYKEVDGAMRFFGSSLDFIVGGPGGPGLTNTRGCANCHPGGGINMKELQAPWTHWAQTDQIDGADELVQNRTAFMGTLNSGIDLETAVIRPGNTEWNKTKAKFLSTTTTADIKKARAALKDDSMNAAAKADLARRQLKRDLNATQMLLEPLFCSVQVNIQASGTFGVPGQLFAAFNGGNTFFSGSVNSDDAIFGKAIDDIGSQVPGMSGEKELTTEFMVIERSGEDIDYMNQLVALKVIDAQFIDDVTMVDFTRGTFSDDRCALLDLVPDVAPASRKGAKLRDAILDAVKASKPKAGSAAAQLVKHLEATKAKKSVDFQAVMQKYSDACTARPPAEMVRDGLKLRSLQRQVAFGDDGKADDAKGAGLHPFAVFEFEQTMPVDDVAITSGAAAGSVDKVAMGARFSPNDCKLVDTFVAPE